MGPFGVDHAVDQIERLEAFQREHPEWRVFYEPCDRAWHGERDRLHGSDTHVRSELRFLLDCLEEPVKGEERS